MYSKVMISLKDRLNFMCETAYYELVTAPMSIPTAIATPPEIIDI